MMNNSLIPTFVQYGSALLQTGPGHRNNIPGADEYGSGKDPYLPKLVQDPNVIGPQNQQASVLGNYSMLQQNWTPFGFDGNYQVEYHSPDLNGTKENYTPSLAKWIDSPDKEWYVYQAGQSLNVVPDTLMKVFFSMDNITHLQKVIVEKVKEITAISQVGGTPEGITIQTPQISEMFQYMINDYKNYKYYNGSICFVHLRNNGSVASELSKLNTNFLQEYVSKLVSQINMYIHYYRDASQLPEQLSLPQYTSMKGSKSLEYNTGFQSGNSLGIAAFNQTGNIIS